MSKNCDAIVTFLIYGQSGEIRSRIPDAWPVKRTFSLRVTFYLTQTENRSKKPLTQPSYNLVQVLFLTKNANFLQRKC